MSTTAGIVLAGGFGRRFGEADKTLAELAGEPLLVHAVRSLAPVVDEVLVSCRAEQVPAFEAVLDAEVTFCPDPTPDEGPLAGLATALRAVDAELTLLATADMPCVPSGLYRQLLEEIDAEALAIREDSIRQPTPAAYRTAPLRSVVEERVAAGEQRLRAVFDALTVTEWSTVSVCEQWGEDVLADVNTRSDLERVDCTDR